MRGRILGARFSLLALLFVPGCGGNSPTAPSETFGGPDGRPTAFSYLPASDVDPAVQSILPQGQRRFLLMVSRRGGEPGAPQPIPATCLGVPARDSIILAFLASAIVRDEDRVSGSSDDLPGGRIPGAVRFFIEGTISGATLQLNIRSEPPEFGYREEWTATLRSEGTVGIVEGQSSGSFTLNDCVARWAGEPFVARIVNSPPPTPVACPPPGPTPTANPGTMTAMIDGVPWCAPINQAVIATGNALIISAIGDPGMAGLALSAPAQVGTHTVGMASPVTAILFASPTTTWMAVGPLGSGSMTISTLTATSATGTFSFTLTPSEGTGQNRIVTNGAFNARIPTP